MEIKLLVGIRIILGEIPSICSARAVTGIPVFRNTIVAYPRLARATPTYKVFLSVSTNGIIYIGFDKVRNFQTCIIISLHNLGVPVVLGIEEAYTWVTVVDHEVNHRLCSRATGESVAPVIDTVVHVSLVTGQTHVTLVETYILVQCVNITAGSARHVSSDLFCLRFVLCQQADSDTQLQGVGEFRPLLRVTAVHHILVGLHHDI